MALNRTHKVFIVSLLGAVAFVLLAKYLKNAQNTTMENMTVVLRAKVTKDDTFQFFYWESSEETFKIKNSVRTAVRGSADFQDIVFELPVMEELRHIRLDIGEDIDQDPVTIKEIKFIKADDVLVYGAADFNKLFAPNPHIDIMAPNVFDGKPYFRESKPIYDPYFISIDDSAEMQSIRVNMLTNYPYAVAAFTCLVALVFLLYNIERISFTLEGVFIALFLLVLVLPSVQTKLQFTAPLENIEKRKLAEKPNFSLTKKFAREYEAYYDDNFGLRNHMINWGGTYRTKLFRSSMHPELVKFGRDKWLYYNKMGGRMYRSYSRRSLLSPNEVQRIVNGWILNKERYEAQGRKYFLGFWPNKHSIYPEHLPSTMSVQIKDTLSRVDQLLEYTQKNNTSIKLTDVRPRLLESKGNLPLYHKFDTHWNEYGAFLAYQDFFNQNPGLGMPPKTESDFDIVWSDYSWGELIQMLGVRNKGFFIEKNPKFTLKKNKDQIEYLPIEGFPQLTVITRNEQSGNKLRALIFRDSYTRNLVQFFSLHFYEVYYIWGHHEEYVDQLQPDVIIEGFVEREMGEKIPQP